MNQRTLMLTALPLAALLAGCQSFGANSRQVQAGIRVTEPIDSKVMATQQISEGRAALATRNYATAVASFRNAALEPSAAAEAHNGLAIAYAGIGRTDLADRYFRMAIAEAPENPRYQANLVRLDRAQQATAALAAASLAPQRRVTERRLAGTASRASILLVAPQRRLERISATSVLLREPRAGLPIAGVSLPGTTTDRRAPSMPSLGRASLQPIVRRESSSTPVAVAPTRQRKPVNPVIATTAVLVPRAKVPAWELSPEQARGTGARARITLARGEFVGSARLVETTTHVMEKPVLPVPLFGMEDAVFPIAELALNSQ